MSPHPSNRRLSQYVLSQLDHHLLPVLLVIGVAGACSHTQTPEAPRRPTAAVAVERRRAAPPPPPPPEPAAAPVDNGKSNKELAVYFDFDSALLRDDARPVLQKVAAIAKNRTTACASRGTATRSAPSSTTWRWASTARSRPRTT